MMPCLCWEETRDVVGYFRELELLEMCRMFRGAAVMLQACVDVLSEVQDQDCDRHPTRDISQGLCGHLQEKPAVEQGSSISWR
jgi:hypothetical protein